MKKYQSLKYRIVKTLRKFTDEVREVYVIRVQTWLNKWRDIDWYYSLDACKEHIIRREKDRFMKVRVKNKTEEIICNLEVVIDDDMNISIIESQANNS